MINKILIVGCGGVGSEIIKLLVNSDFELTIIDFDKIEISNLNRQFYFTKNDISDFKASVISKKIRKLNSNFKITAINEKIEELNYELFERFDCVISCLDSVSARMNLNFLLFKNNWVNSNKIFIDCGVENLNFHVKRVTQFSSCLYCIKDLYKAEAENYICSSLGSCPIVTRENRNKILNHMVSKNKTNEDLNEILIRKIVTEFNSIISEDADEADEFEVLGLFKNIIPNICTINAMCASYAIRMLFSNQNHDFIIYDGREASNIQFLVINKDENCFVCNKRI